MAHPFIVSARHVLESCINHQARLCSMVCCPTGSGAVRSLSFQENVDECGGVLDADIAVMIDVSHSDNVAIEQLPILPVLTSSAQLLQLQKNTS